MRMISRKEVQKQFKIQGYTLKVDAILSLVSRFPDAESEDIDVLLDELDNEPLKSSILDKEPVQRVVGVLLAAESAVGDSVDDLGVGGAGTVTGSGLSFLDAFIVPRFRFDSIQKVYYEYTGRLPFHGDTSAKAALYRDRFDLLFQRLSRHPHFSKPAFDIDLSSSGSCEIVPLQNLSWQTGRRWIMGVISQLEDGHFYHEDLSASVEIDLSDADYLPRTLLSSLKVSDSQMVFLRDGNAKIMPQLNTWHGNFLIAVQAFRRNSEGMEHKAANDMFVILSDIWLDDEEIMRKLETVLDGYEDVEMVPSLFVLMGNFCSRPCNLSFHSFSTLRFQFEKLGKMIADHPRLKEQSRFLFIPGPDDAGPSTCLPRCALPKYFTNEIQKHVPNALFMSNPCRIKFYSQEIVVFRQDLLYKMRRSCLLPPSTDETSDSFGHLVATMIHRSHLCPLPLSVQPIIRNYDHSLHLCPTPHTIIFGDKCEQKVFNYAGVTCFNPGSFSNNSTFVAYRPCTREAELSAL